ncbi:hypothetical protein [Streptomyces sp. RPT161]|uniref:hypothetical protein n=1 Tax=Streptomyces sp. RPT161 TaxID=3015993 RepID=UPI002FD10D1C
MGLPRMRFTTTTGPSGSGKSTLMRCAAGARHPHLRFRVHRRHRAGGSLIDGQLTLLRREHVGFGFRSFNLVARPHCRRERDAAHKLGRTVMVVTAPPVATGQAT